MSIPAYIQPNALVVNSDLYTTGVTTFGTDRWHISVDGKNRFYFGNGNTTYFGGGNGIIFGEPQILLLI